MRDEFVERWELHYGDKYPFEPKDAAQLAAFIHKHPNLVPRWSDMITRYLADGFWAQQRHPLLGLATHPVTFAGERNGTSTKVQQGRDALRDWFEKGSNNGNP